MIRKPERSAPWRRTVEEDRIVDLLLVRGWPIDLRNGNRTSAEREARDALERFIALGLPHEISSADDRRFDPVEVTNFVVWAGRMLGDPTYREKNMASARQIILQEDVGSGTQCDLRRLTRDRSSRYRFHLRRSFNLAGHEVGRRIRLRLPSPLEDELVGELQTEFSMPDAADVKMVEQPARFDLVLSVPPSQYVTAAFTSTFTARPVPRSGRQPSLETDEAETYSRSDEGLIKLSDQVRSLADRLAGDANDAHEAIRRFWAFFLDRMVVDAIHYDRLDPARPLDTILESGWCDCRTGAALFVALCRARGIPARLVNGYALYRTTPFVHTWAEVWVEGEGWLPVDLYSWCLTDDHWGEAEWSHYFIGRIDHRMAFERPPSLFGGTGAISFPTAWHMLYYADGAGFTTEFRCANTGEMIYKDYVELERLD